MYICFKQIVIEAVMGPQELGIDNMKLRFNPCKFMNICRKSEKKITNSNNIIRREHSIKP